MDKRNILKHVDHTLLKAFATWEDIVELCDEAILYQTASVCVPPSYVRRIHDTYGDELIICTVIGFPLGYHTADVKAAETAQAVRDGADEIDMVVNIGDVKSRLCEKVEAEIRMVKEACAGRILKVIIETCLLTDEEKKTACELSKEAGADFVKTSTGFSTGGAKAADVELMRKTVGEETGVKASGGIHTAEEAQSMIDAGASRLGTSATLSIIGKA